MQQQRAKDVTLISVSVDDQDEFKDAVKFLRDNKAPGPNFLVNDADGLKKEWGLQGVPYLVVVDRAGNIAKKFNTEDEFTHKDLEKFVDELVKK